MLRMALGVWFMLCCHSLYADCSGRSFALSAGLLSVLNRTEFFFSAPMELADGGVGFVSGNTNMESNYPNVTGAAMMAYTVPASGVGVNVELQINTLNVIGTDVRNTDTTVNMSTFGVVANVDYRSLPMFKSNVGIYVSLGAGILYFYNINMVYDMSLMNASGAPVIIVGTNEIRGGNTLMGKFKLGVESIVAQNMMFAVELMLIMLEDFPEDGGVTTINNNSGSLTAPVARDVGVTFDMARIFMGGVGLRFGYFV